MKKIQISIWKSDLMSATAVLEGSREMAEDVAEPIVWEKKLRGQLRPSLRSWDLLPLGSSGAGTTLERIRRGIGIGRPRVRVRVGIGDGIGGLSGGRAVTWPVARSPTLEAPGCGWLLHFSSDLGPTASFFLYYSSYFLDFYFVSFSVFGGNKWRERVQEI